MKKSKIAFIAIFAFLVFALTACSGAFSGEGAGGTGTITIDIGGSANAQTRATGLPYPPTDHPEILSELVLRIKLENSARTQNHTLDKGVTSAKFSVAAGHWRVTVDAYHEGDHYATGNGSADVKAGQTNQVTIMMSRIVYNEIVYHTITFNLNYAGAAAIDSVYALTGGTAALPDNPARPGYVFNGWNTAADGGGTAFTAATVVTRDWTVYAQWIMISGDGSAASPYLITTAAQLDAVRYNVAAHYRLDADIDISHIPNWTPIGDSYDTSFSGTFDGNGKTIIGLTITSGGSYIGLFGITHGDGVVKNLGLTNVNINTTASPITGGIAGYNIGTIKNCYVRGEIIRSSYTGSSNTGGIAGCNFGTIENCYSAIKLEGRINTGGIAGQNGGTTATDGGTISYCYSTSEVTYGASNKGGIVGLNQNSGTVQNCIAINTSITGGYVGRVAGSSSGTLSDNYGLTEMPGTWNNKGHTAIDGEDVSTAQSATQSWWTGTANWTINATGSETAPWVWGSNNLPKLWFMP